MKKILVLLVLLFSPSVFADDISDLEIEGMSIGDSLLEYMIEEEIKKEIKNTRYMYDYLEEKFSEVYFYKKFETYDFVSFMVKPNDKKYIIHNIRGVLSYDGNMSECYIKQIDIAEEFSVMFKNATKTNNSFNHSVDPTGRSKVVQVKFEFKSGDVINIYCLDFEENIKNKNNWSDSLNIIIQTKEVNDWLS